MVGVGFGAGLLVGGAGVGLGTFTWEDTHRAQILVLKGQAEILIELGHFADAYIGDYVTKLENLVESYRQTHNFHEGTDTAVISLPDDVKNSRAFFSVPVNNLLYQAGQLDAVQITDDAGLVTPPGWSLLGCRLDTTTNQPLPNCVGAFELPLLGRHNVRNAVGAIAVGATLGIASGALEDGLRAFRGVKRRLEVVDRVKGITIYDDFAHHPTAVRGTVEAVRARAGPSPTTTLVPGCAEDRNASIFFSTATRPT